MEKEENTVEIQDATTESQTETVEQAVTEEAPTAESQGETAEETPEAKLAQAQAEAAKYRRLFEKATKPKDAAPKAAQQSVSPQLNVEETVLLANGMPEELVNELKIVAQARGLKSLIKAQIDPIFVAVKEKFEKDKKQKDASLPASRGAGGVKPVKSINSPGLSREEHKRMVLDSR